MQPRLFVSEITFSDATTVRLNKGDVVVVVGANNSGKSAALRAVQGKLNGNFISPVILNVAVDREGTAEDVAAWLESFTRADPQAQDPTYQALGHAIRRSQIGSYWQSMSANTNPLARFFCNLLTADQRLFASNPAPNIAITRDPPNHPLHYLFRDDRLEQKLSSQFRQAFGADLIVNRAGGNQIPLHVGTHPSLQPGQDRLSFDYLQELDKLPFLQVQGDGMRSFAGVLLSTAVGRETILLIDEPEAFLHPPQARQLGRMLVEDAPEHRQLFVATHSGDVLRGMLDATGNSIRVVRLRREGSVNLVSQLDNEKIAELWNDSLLRYSNILDGLFHERVIVCEGDADARFYSAIMDELLEASGQDRRRPDVMFTHCGGKDRMPVVVRALHEVAVPVSAIVDFDILNSEQPLRGIIEAAGHDWITVRTEWQQVKAAIDAKKPELAAAEVIAEIQKVLNAVSEPVFPNAARESIRKVFRRSSPWATAKEVGRPFVPPGQPTQAYEKLVRQLEIWGIFVVDVGEVENFARSVGLHGPRWVSGVLKKNLRDDAELAPARGFVARILGISHRS